MLLLENDADIRSIQALLGYVRLGTTEVYTQVSIRRLKEVHSMTHPGNVYLADGSYGKVRKWDSDTHMVTTIMGGGSSSSEGASATSYKLIPGGIAVASSGKIYVSDVAVGRIVERHPTTFAATVLSGKKGTVVYRGDGESRHHLYPSRASSFYERTTATGETTGDWLFVDYYDYNKFKIIRENAGANGEDIVATYPIDISLVGGMYAITGITEYAGDIYISAASSAKVIRIEMDWSNAGAAPVKIPGSETLIAGTGIKGYDAADDGNAATLAKLNRPGDIAFDDVGNLYIADTNNHCVRKVDTAGIITTFAGTCGTIGFSGDGGPATSALLRKPEVVVIGANGDVFIGDTANSRVRKVDGVTGTISTFAGGGTQGFKNGVLATEAYLPSLKGIAYDDVTGDLYVSHHYRDRVRRIQKSTQAEFDYDASGRMTQQGNRDLIYDQLDQLIEVKINNVTVSKHSYGYEGQRTSTEHPHTGKIERWFTGNLVQYGDSDHNSDSVVRHHYVKLGSRLIARVDQCHGTNCPIAESAGGGGGGGSAWTSPLYWIFSALFLFGLSLFLARRKGRLLQLGFATGLLGILMSCGNLGLLSNGLRRGLEADFNSVLRTDWSDTKVTYFHKGIAAGPVMLTSSFADSDGSYVVSERQYEPFGQLISGSSAGDHNFEPHGMVNKPHDTATDYSYHGARWLAPQIARWLTPDPPAKGPDPKFMVEPWEMHPYQYVNQNPIMFWDPDGNRKNIISASQIFSTGPDSWENGANHVSKNQLSKLNKDKSKISTNMKGLISFKSEDKALAYARKTSLQRQSERGYYQKGKYQKVQYETGAAVVKYKGKFYVTKVLDGEHKQKGDTASGSVSLYSLIKAVKLLKGAELVAIGHTHPSTRNAPYAKRQIDITPSGSEFNGNTSSCPYGDCQPGDRSNVFTRFIQNGTRPPKHYIWGADGREKQYSNTKAGDRKETQSKEFEVNDGWN